MGSTSNQNKRSYDVEPEVACLGEVYDSDPTNYLTGLDEYQPSYAGNGNFFSPQLSDNITSQQYTSLNTLPPNLEFPTDMSNLDPIDFFINNGDPSSLQLPELSTSLDPSELTTKRFRDNTDDEPLSACWKSELCPRRTADGSKPSSCNGECAPFLFADSPASEEDKSFSQSVEAKVKVEYPEQLSRKHRMASAEPQRRASTRSSTVTSANSDNPKSLSPQALAKDDVPNQPRATVKPKGRLPHNEVEKKYREKVNAQLDSLRRVLPVQKWLATGPDGTGADIEDMPAKSTSKAAVMSSATAYIKQLQRDVKKLEEELAKEKERNAALQGQRDSKCGNCSLMSHFVQLRVQNQG